MSGDEFEAKYMSDGAKVLHRQKRVSRKMTGLLMMPSLWMLILAIVVPLINASSSKPMSAAMVPWFAASMVVASVVSLVLAIAFGVLRFVVTERAVHVKFGLWGPTIPLESIVSCNVVDYDWKQYGGWGIRRGIDGSWAYVASSGRVVEVRYTEGAKTKKVVLGADDADALARAITEARQRARARVSVQEENGIDAEVAADAEEDAALESSRRERAR
jgi:hypothetical protein